MSRRCSTSSAKAAPQDRDVVMGPPPAPVSTGASQQPNQDINEKYRQLKRRFFELEEKHKETSTELQRSGERNVKMREERNILLDRIIELENEYSFKSNNRLSLSPPLSSPLAQPGSSALPRTLLGARARASFVANLLEAVDDPDDDGDPILSSRHVGPEARRRSEEESRERFDEESHEPRRSSRRTRSSLSQAGVANNKGEGGSANHIASGSRSSPPIASPSRGQSKYYTTPSTQSHSHLYTHPPPPPPPSFQDQRYSNPRQNSATSDQADYHQSQSSGSGIEMGDDSASGVFDYTPPSSSLLVRGAGTSAQDHNSNDRDHRSNGNADPNLHDGTTVSPNSPLHNEYIGNPGSDSRKPDSTSVPRRESTRTRRSTRVGNAAARQVDDDQPEPPRRTRAASKRGNPSASPRAAIKTRAARRGNATAVAIADKEPQIAEILSSAVAVSETGLQDVQMDNTSCVDEATPNHGGTVPTTGVPAPSHPPYLDPALASQSTAQGTAPSSSPAPAKPSEPSASRPSPMESIVRVAEAAVAAQNAANVALNQTSLSSASPSSTQPTVVTTNLPQNGATSSTPTSAASPSTSTFNPYMMLGTMKPTVNAVSPGMPSPGVSVHPLALGMNPYAMYYPPGMPMSPSTPTYPYANPYYYMGPGPGPNGMYPPSPNFAPPNGQRAPGADGQHAKPKRLKAHTVTSKNFSIPMVPRDKSGKPMLPLNVGIMTVIKLGDVCMREHFHTERYIFPVGYEVSRRYLSTMDANIEVVYHCTILDGGDGPKFQIIPSDVPDRPVIAGTATGAWSSIVKQANAIRNRQHSNSVSGPDFFGLGQNTIKHLIQELPNADRLRDYVWQRFIEGGPLGGRHAAVIPALPEEFDSHSVGALHYDKQKDTSAVLPTSSPKGIYHYPQHIQQQAIQQQASSSQGPQPSERGGGYYPDHQDHYTEQQSLSRTTRSNATAGDSDTPSGSVRSTRSSTRSQARQSHGSADSNSSNVIPATIATLLNAYPSGGPGPHG